MTYEQPDLYCQCTLLFLIPMDGETGEINRRFEHADVMEDHKFQWTSKITGAQYVDSFQCRQEVSWATARRILGELASQAERLPQGHHEAFELMLAIANADGHWPHA